MLTYFYGYFFLCTQISSQLKLLFFIEFSEKSIEFGKQNKYVFPFLGFSANLFCTKHFLEKGIVNLSITIFFFLDCKQINKSGNNYFKNEFIYSED